MVVDVDDVLCLQLVAEVVDLVLDVERAVNVVALLAAGHELVHVRQGILCETHHLVQMTVLLLVEMILLGSVLAVDGACHVVAGIAYRLQLADFAQHGTYFSFRLVAEVGIADLLQVFGNLQFHIVADTLIFFYA